MPRAAMIMISIEIDRDGEARPRAEALEGGDDLALAVEIAGDGVGDADPADHQRGQADQRQELGEALDIAFEARCGVGPRPHPPGAVGEGFSGGLAEGIDFSVGRRVGEEHPVAPLDQAARLDQAGRRQRLLRDHQPRSEGEAVGEAVGLVGDDAAEDEFAFAEQEAVADREPGAGQQLGFGQRAGEPVGLGKERVRIAAAFDRDRADQRVEAVDGLQFDQRLAFAVGGAGDGAERRHLRHRAALVEPGAFLRRRLALEQRHRDIAAEDGAAFVGEALGHAAGDRADPGDGGDAEDDAGEEDAEAGEAAAELAEGEAEGEREGCGHEAGVSR